MIFIWGEGVLLKVLPSHLPFYLPFLFKKPSAIYVYLSFSIVLPIQNYLSLLSPFYQKISVNFS